MAFASGTLAIPLTGALLFAGGEIASVANPEGVPIIITDVKLYVTHVSTGAANGNFGIGASAVTSYNTLIAALDLVASAVGGYHGMPALVANAAALVWGVAQFLTVTGTASTVGFTGTLFVDYIRTS
jgi:hypothetical protein